MKNPLHYQLTEYDCGPTSMLNALSFLFHREAIAPEIVRNIMLYSLDTFGKEGAPGKSGTSRMAMMFLSNWLDGYGQAGLLPIRTKYLRGEQVTVRAHCEITDALRRNGAAVVRLYQEGEHYVLFTGVKEQAIRLFDPYYQESVPEADVTVVNDHPAEYNRIVSFAKLCAETRDSYALGNIADREAVLLYNTETMLTEERTIEYYI